MLNLLCLFLVRFVTTLFRTPLEAGFRTQSRTRQSWTMAGGLRWRWFKIFELNCIRGFICLAAMWRTTGRASSRIATMSRARLSVCITWSRVSPVFGVLITTFIWTRDGTNTWAGVWTVQWRLRWIKTSGRKVCNGTVLFDLLCQSIFLAL